MTEQHSTHRNRERSWRLAHDLEAVAPLMLRPSARHVLHCGQTEFMYHGETLACAPSPILTVSTSTLATERIGVLSWIQTRFLF